MKKNSREDLREEIISSKTYKKFKRIVENIRDQFDPGAIDSEIKTLHAGRLVRNLTASKINAQKMIEAVSREVSYRSRIVEIRISLVDQRINLKRSLSVIKNYLLSEFVVEGLRTKSDRQAYFSRYLGVAEFLLAEIDRLISNCDYIVKDIDQAGFGTKLIAESLEMIYVREKSI
jgi:hypothetical protein